MASFASKLLFEKELDWSRKSLVGKRPEGYAPSCRNKISNIYAYADSPGELSYVGSWIRVSFP